MTRTRSALLTLLLVVAAVAPTMGAAAAADALSVGVAQADDGTATVTVTDNGTAVANATVVVSTANASYAGNGTYETDANGTVALPEPADDVTVTVSASADNATGSTTADLVGANPLSVGVAQDADGSATVTVYDEDGTVANATVEVSTENASYAGNGSYETDANGTVGLPAPAENVTISVTATDGDRSAATTAALDGLGEEDADEAFGQQVSDFVHWLHDNAESFTPGAVAEFVTEHNPGNAPDHAGPNDDDDADGNETASPGNSNGHGPDGNDGNGQGNGNGHGPGGNNGNGNGHGPSDDADESDE